MKEDVKLTEMDLGDIILCEPITRKGKNSLDRLGLKDDITTDLFYEKMFIKSRYSKEIPDSVPNIDNDNEKLYYQYTLGKKQLEDIKNKQEKFDKHFTSDKRYEYPLYILGVAGNGKSIEVNKRISDITKINSNFKGGKVLLDLEKSFTQKTYGITYSCPNKNSALWLFCIKLLDGVMQYIKNSSDNCSQIYDNFNKLIKKNNIANKEQTELFESIGNYDKENINTETIIFEKLTNQLTSSNVYFDINSLLSNLMYVMYCDNPSRKNYVVVDNVEQYVKINENKIQIRDSDLMILHEIINDVVANVSSEFDRIETDLSWRAFKIVFVLRRTSISLFCPDLLHSVSGINYNVNDITGSYSIPDIWNKKKEYIWDERLKKIFKSTDSSEKIKLLDTIIFEGKNANGTGYQNLISPLMSYGIRRNARAQAHAAYELHTILRREYEYSTVKYEEFFHILDNINKENSSIPFMFRRALIELQFKWSIQTENQERWKNLNLGHIIDDPKKNEVTYRGKIITNHNVDYDDDSCITLIRRILSYLSHFPDEYSNIGSKNHSSISRIFTTVSLFDLVNGVLVNPTTKNSISDKEYYQLAKVIIAMCDMSNNDTRSAPFAILSINDENVNSKNFDEVLAQILKEIYTAGKSQSLPHAKYNCNDFGLRLTDSGYTFLLDWQASFSFFVSLYCFTIPPLLLLKDITVIEYVIDTVYKKAEEMCKKYEDEAKSFCGTSLTLKNGKYLPLRNNKPVSFRTRVRQLHVAHLGLYKTYLKNNYDSLGISYNDVINLIDDKTGFITSYINRYKSWEKEEEKNECF